MSVWNDEIAYYNRIPAQVAARDLQHQHHTGGHGGATATTKTRYYDLQIYNPHTSPMEEIDDSRSTIYDSGNHGNQNGHIMFSEGSRNILNIHRPDMDIHFYPFEYDYSSCIQSSADILRGYFPLHASANVDIHFDPNDSKPSAITSNESSSASVQGEVGILISMDREQPHLRSRQHHHRLQQQHDHLRPHNQQQQQQQQLDHPHTKSQHQRRPAPDERDFASSHSASTTSTSSTAKSKNDYQASFSTIEISPGMYMRLRGAEETRLAVENDAFSPCRCLACGEDIFCVNGAEYVLCPTCRFVTPMCGQECQQHCDVGGVGIGFTMSDLAKFQEAIVQEQGSPNQPCEVVAREA